MDGVTEERKVVNNGMGFKRNVGAHWRSTSLLIQAVITSTTNGVLYINRNSSLSVLELEV